MSDERLIQPHRVYKTIEVAILIKTRQKNVLDLLKSGQLRGRLVGKAWKITGKAILDFLTPEDREFSDTLNKTNSVLPEAR